MTTVTVARTTIITVLVRAMFALAATPVANWADPINVSWAEHSCCG